MKAFSSQIFDLNQIRKIVLIQNHLIWNFNATDLLYILLKFIEMLWSYEKCQKIGVGKGMDQVRTKNLLAQKIADKIHATKRINPVKLDMKRKVWYLFLRVF